LQLALDVIAGPDALASQGWKLELPAPRADRLQDFRVGYWSDDPFCPIDSTVHRELQATIDALRPHVELVEIGKPLDLAVIVPLYVRLLMGVIGGGMPKPLKALTSALLPFYALSESLGIDGDAITKNAARGIGLSHSEWNSANEGRTRLRWQCHELFKNIDVLLTPVGPVTAFPHQTGGNHMSRRIMVDGRKRPYMDHVSWIALATVAFLPATTAPVGVTTDGLPVCMQIVGPFLGDRTTIRFAELMSETRGGFQPPPGY
jgi:amidase